MVKPSPVLSGHTASGEALGRFAFGLPSNPLLVSLAAREKLDARRWARVHAQFLELDF